MLEFYKLSKSVDELADNTAKRFSESNRNLPAAQNTLRALAIDPGDLQTKIKKALELGWRGASFEDEPIDSTIKVPQPHPERVNIIAADGSQIFPDRHGISLYYLINIGSIIFRYGLKESPSVATRVDLLSKDDDLYDGDGVISPEKISAQRNFRELAELANLSTVESENIETVALLDNGLLPVFLDRASEDKAPSEFIKNSLIVLSAIAKHEKATIAGVVDRPRAANVISLLHLSQVEMAKIDQAKLRISNGPFRHITDAMLFNFLKPGERSAIFITESWPNREKYQEAGQLIYFFYLNAGRSGNTAILRIEVPQWVAKSKAKLELVHATIYEQCKVLNGFPYVLTRADEMAVVTGADRQVLEEMIATALVRKGLPLSLSQKQQGKRQTRGKR